MKRTHDTPPDGHPHTRLSRSGGGRRVRRTARCLARLGALVPFAIAFQSGFCLPDDAIREVLAENIVLTTSIAIQSVVSIILGNVFQFV